MGYSSKPQEVPENGGLIARPFFTLFHELFHAFDSNNGYWDPFTLVRGIASYGTAELPKGEWQGNYDENLLREEIMNTPFLLNYKDLKNLQLRDYYELPSDDTRVPRVKLTPKGKPYIPYEYTSPKK